jgi:hypothetical protein
VALYKSSSPNSEILGQAIQGYILGMGAFEATARDILQAHNLDRNPRPDGWYSQQAFLDALKEIAERIGPNTMRQIGKNVALVVPLPPEIDTLEKALSGISQGFKASHRGGTVPRMEFIKTGENAAKIVSGTPYPTELEMGMLAGYAARFGKTIKISLDKSQPMRNSGGGTDTFLLKW